MGAVSSTVQTNNQKSLNSITQASTASCTTTCNQIQSGNTIFITGSNVGNVQFNQQCTVDAKCQIDNSVAASAKSLLDSKQNGTAKPGFFLGLAQVNSNVQINQQDMENIIKQKLDSACNNGATQVQTANLIYVQNSTTKDIGFNQNSDVTSQCILSNLAKGTAEATATNDQFAQAGGFGGGLIAGLIVLIIIIVVIIALVSASNKKKQQKQQQQQSGGGGGGGGGLNVGGAVQGAGAGAKFGEPGIIAGSALGALSGKR